MPTTRRGIRVCALAALLALVTACARRDPAEARDRALAYFASEVHEVDPGWSSIVDLLHRRFGVEVPLAGGRPAHGALPAERSDVAAVYRRLEDPNARATRREIAELPTAIDRVTATALHCDHVGLPDDWLEVLREATRLGAYALTHAVAATRWTVENGCLPPARVLALELEQIDALVRLLEQRHGLAERHALATDIWIEALAMLHYLDAAERVQPAWIDDLLAAQRPDGGWPNHPDDARSHPHPTALALWVLLERLEPAAGPARWIPRG